MTATRCPATSLYWVPGGGQLYQTRDSSSPGSSDSWAKLVALQFPDLRDRSFLDIGCAEGFFCGFAVESGASKVVGIDVSSARLSIARSEVPDAEFICSTWDELPQWKFDVILLSSALHYAANPQALIKALMDRLATDGVLVLEVPVLDEDGSDFRPTTRIVGDSVLVPQRNAIRQLANRHGWGFRVIGPSVQQNGDQNRRMVYHLAPRLTDCLLLLERSTWGKSTKARDLARHPDLVLIQGDDLLHELFAVSESGSESLRRVIQQSQEGSTTRNWGLAYEAIVEHGRVRDFLAVAFAGLETGKVPVIDAYFPEESREIVAETVRSMGYHPVFIQWEHPIKLVDRELEATAFANYSSALHHDTRSEPQSFLASGNQGAESLWDLTPVRRIVQERDSFKLQADQLGEEITKLKDALNTASGQREQLQLRIEATVAALVRAEDARRATAEELQQLIASRTWRWTKPFRRQ